MNAIMIRCPSTGRDVGTGIAIEPADFDRERTFWAYTVCPLCWTTHEWFAREAWVYAPAPSRAPGA